MKIKNSKSIFFQILCTLFNIPTLTLFLSHCIFRSLKYSYYPYFLNNKCTLKTTRTSIVNPSFFFQQNAFQKHQNLNNNLHTFDIQRVRHNYFFLSLFFFWTNNIVISICYFYCIQPNFIGVLFSRWL